ncbi:MAG: TetR/AcrR family transcriptional regulator [Actinomycetota bacterium]
MSSVTSEPSAAPLSRADRKVQIQQGIVEAALALTERHGVDGWTMQMLAAELGWSTGAAYRHLAGKDALLESVAIEVLKRVEIPDTGDGPWEERLQALAWSTWRQLSKQRWIAQYILNHQEAGKFANRFFGAPLVAIFAEAGYDLNTVSLPIGLYSAFMFGSLCGFEADPSARSRSRSRRMKGYSADAHFEWGLSALIAAIRAQSPGA